MMQKKRAAYYSVCGAMMVGLLVRCPGIFWGNNFPTGWYGHHVDEYTHLVNAEMLINPSLPPRWDPHPYPKGMAAHVAVPMVVGLWLATGTVEYEVLPSVSAIIVTGRVISVLYGVATILIVFLLASRLFLDSRVASLSTWILALGGLHVSQSHYFVADVPSIFWYLLGSYLLLRELERAENDTASESSNSLFLMLGAACLGISFGIKFSVFCLPTLFVIALMHRPRPTRLFQAGGFFLIGFILVNMGSYTAYEIAKTFYKGTSDPYEFSWWSSVILYLVEMPTIISFPATLMFLGGMYCMLRGAVRMGIGARSVRVLLIVIMPILVNILFIVVNLDHFPRHLLSLIPWIVMVTAWTLVRVSDRAALKGLHPALIVIPFFLYLALFVYDGEKVFINEPRNKAARWILENVPAGGTIDWRGHNWIPGYRFISYPEGGKPDVVAVEMHHANHYLSGMGLRNSFPKDYRRIFGSRSQDEVGALQSLFKGTSEYVEVKRFKEGYFMPEFILVDYLIGNRSRNYVAEIVIFKKKAV
ncbi:MAG: phospholipid carrier-dependent glycosyltransferase [Nitrososphaera sp.]|nr:phospholipid carrier-dependent glycosyltransferase [Nitrososphaera sp.]